MPFPDQLDTSEKDFDVKGVAELRHNGPANLYILDRDLRVILSPAGESDSLLGLIADVPCCRDSRLPEPLDTFVRDLVGQARGSKSARRLTAFIKHDITASVSLLDGSGGEHVAVVLEKVRMRDTICRARERYSLSPREAQVVELIIKGNSTTGIASLLAITEATVHEHVRNIARKTRARNRPDIVARVLTGR